MSFQENLEKMFKNFNKYILPFLFVVLVALVAVLINIILPDSYIEIYPYESTDISTYNTLNECMRGKDINSTHECIKYAYNIDIVLGFMLFVIFIMYLSICIYLKNYMIFIYFLTLLTITYTLHSYNYLSYLNDETNEHGTIYLGVSLGLVIMTIIYILIFKQSSHSKDEKKSNETAVST